MKIWFATVGLGRNMGGVGVVARCTARAIAEIASEESIEFEIISLYNCDEPLGFLPAHLQRRVKYSECGRKRFIFLLRILRQAYKKPDLVIYDHVDLAQCQSLLADKVSSRYIVWIHGIEVWKDLPFLKKRALERSGQLLSNSEFTAKKTLTFYPKLQRIKTVLLCAEPYYDKKADSEGEQKIFDKQDESRVLTVGRMESTRPKGHSEVLQVLPDVARRVPDLHWYVVGGGHALEKFKETVACSPVSEKVSILGYVNDATLDRLYSYCDIFCMPSWGEGFGLVYVEAMRHGKPCIYSTQDCASEIIGDAGVPVDLNNPGTIADALVGLLLDDGKRKKLGEIARSRVENMFSYERFCNDFGQVISENLKSH